METNYMICFIPARGGSKSIPNKNIKLLGGKPLIAYSIELGLQVCLRVIVSTDSKEIAQVAKDYGAEVLMREPELAQDDTSMFEVLRAQVPRIDPNEDDCLLLQPTTPFRDIDTVKSAIQWFEDRHPDSLITVEEVPEKFNPAQVIVGTLKDHTMADGRPIKDRLTRRQDFPKAFIPTGSLYIFKIKNLKHGSIYGTDVALFETEHTTNINTEADWLEAELCLQKSSAK